MVECAESLLEQYGYVKPREVIAIVAGTRTRSGSTNFLRLHVMSECKDKARFAVAGEEKPVPVPNVE
jgi:pyruvate kinase